MKDNAKTKTELIAELAELRQQLAELRASEELFRQVVHSISDHIYVTEITPAGEHRNLYISPHAADLTGYPLEKFSGDWSFWPSQVIHPEDRAAAAAQARHLAQGRNSEGEYRMIRADGETIWVRDSGKASYDPARQSKITYGVVSDITERKRLEAHLLAIYQLGQELNLLRDERKIFERVLETIAKVLLVRFASYALVDDESNLLKYGEQLVNSTPALDGAPSRAGVLEPANFQISLAEAEDIGVAVIQRGQAIAVADLTEHEDYRFSTPVAPASRSRLCVPIKINERVIGLLNVESPRPNRFTASDQQILQTLADQAATAIDNARLYEEIGQKVEELASMQMISQTITSTLDLRETLTVITNHAIRLFNARSASLALYEIATGELWVDAISGDPADLIQDKQLPMGKGVVGWVIEQGDPLLIPDVTQDARFSAEFKQQLDAQPHAILCFPLQTRSGIIGVIRVISKRGRRFTLRDLRLLSWLAMPAVTAIENARLYEAQRLAREQAEILREATSALTATLNLDQVLESILTHLKQVVPYDTARIFLWEDEAFRIVVNQGSHITHHQKMGRPLLGAQPHDADELLHPADDAIYQKLRQRGRPLILDDARTDPDFQAWSQEMGVADVKSWMSVPLMVRDELMGYLAIDSHELAAYDQTEAVLAQAFANQAVMAIQNAQLFEQVNIARNRLQSLSHRLVEVQETERRYVARELHDEAGQTLASLMVGLRLLENDAHNPEIISDRIAELKRATEGVLENLHRLALDLHPAALDHAGLIAALRRYAESFGAQHGLTLQFETVGLDEEQRLPAVIETNIYRIVQEALANIARHAQANQADVILERRGDQIITIIEDNGVGFDPETKPGGRLGLLSMRERAEMIGGKLEIESAAGSGTTIHVEIPYAYSDSNR